MLAISLLDLTKHQVANIEGALFDVAVVIPLELLFMTSMPHKGRHSVFFKAVEVDPARPFSRTFIVMLDSWRAEGNISGKDGFRSVDQEERRKARHRADLSPETPDHMRKFCQPTGGVFFGIIKDSILETWRTMPLAR